MDGKDRRHRRRGFRFAAKNFGPEVSDASTAEGSEEDRILDAIVVATNVVTGLGAVSGGGLQAGRRAPQRHPIRSADEVNGLFRLGTAHTGGRTACVVMPPGRIAQHSD